MSEALKIIHDPDKLTGLYVRIEGVGAPRYVSLASRDEIRQDLVLRPDSDIFIVTYPKSGTTWTQNIVRHLLLCGADAPRFSDMALNQRVPYLDMLLFPASQLEEYPEPRVFKSHNTPAELDSMVLKGSTKPKIIYVVRDPRDQIVSFYNHYLAAIGHTTLETFCAQFARHPEYAWGGLWEDHVDAWLSLSDKYDILVLRYEELKQNSRREIRRVADFLGVSVTEEEVGHVARKTTLTYMKKDPQVPRLKLQNTKCSFLASFQSYYRLIALHLKQISKF